MINDKEFETDSIGIKNVNERLKIIFGTNYQMTFKETIYGGVTVIISIVLDEE
ncbi:hypothetical protein ACODH8_00895 [Vagococcus fluvialis]